MQEINKKDVKLYYGLLDHQQTELRAISFYENQGKIHTKVEEVSETKNPVECLNFCLRWHSKANIYAGIHERTPKGTKTKDVVGIRLIGLDIDSKHPRDEAANEEELQKCREFTKKLVEKYVKRFGRPNVIMTGNGFQVIWKIRQIPINDKNRDLIEKKLKKFITDVKEHNPSIDVNIDQIGDLARILKIPGTLSVKGKNTKERPYRLARFVQYNNEPSDTLRDHLLMIEVENERVIEVTAQTIKSRVGKLDNLLEKDKKLKDLYNGSWQGYGYDSRSEAELGLACKLVYYEFSDMEIDMIIRNSGIGKWNEKPDSYKKMTIDKARQKILEKVEKKEIVETELQKVYDVFDKWFHTNEEFKKRIDVILTIALSQRMEGTPIWLIIVGPSGDGKTEVVKALEGLSYTYKVSQITENTIVSGNPKVGDLAPRLNNKIMLITDFASILSLKSDRQREVWAQLRNLYDGEAYKESGAGAEKKYDNLRVTFLACSTPAIDHRILVHQDLGTRELIWRTNLDKEIGMEQKAEAALRNEEYEKQMRDEVKETVHNFLGSIKLRTVDVPDDMNKWLLKKSIYLATMRATVSVDSYSGELLSDVVREVPTRLIKQLKRLYILLKNLSNDYSTERAKGIIEDIVDSSAKNIRVKIMDILEKATSELSLSQVAEETKLGKKTVAAELNALWNLNLIKRETIRTEQFGREFEISKWYCEPNVEFGKEEIIK